MTAVSDETGREALREAAQAVLDRWATPTWKDAPATAVVMSRLQAALSAAPVETITVPFNPCLAKLRDGEPFFVLIGRDKQAPNAVMTWARDREAAEGPSPWVEQAREVAATMAAYSGAAPVAQEPVAYRYRSSIDPDWIYHDERLPPHDMAWQDEGLEEQGLYRSTPAGVGADGIARVFARWKQSKNLHESLAAQNIEKELLALLSRGSGDQK